jgi:hypothetical protein
MLSELETEHEGVERSLEAAKGRQGNVEKWREQKRTVLALYEGFAAQAPMLFSPEHRRQMYERLGLKVTTYKGREPLVEITLDPHRLPPVEEAREAVEAAWEAAMRADKVATLEDVPVPDESTRTCRRSTVRGP